MKLNDLSPTLTAVVMMVIAIVRASFGGKATPPACAPECTAKSNNFDL